MRPDQKDWIILPASPKGFTDVLLEAIKGFRIQATMVNPYL